MSNRRRVLEVLCFWTALGTKQAFGGGQRVQSDARPSALETAARSQGEGGDEDLGAFPVHGSETDGGPDDADLIPFVRGGRGSYVASGAYGDSLLRRQFVADYASLRRYTGAVDVLQVLGGTKGAMTGGLGVFVRDAGDTASHDDGAIVIVADNGTRWKRRFDGPVRAAWWGAVGDGKHDDAGPLQAALDYAANHAATLEIGTGDFRCGKPLLLETAPYNTHRTFRIVGQGQVASVGKGTRIFYDGPQAPAMLTLGRNADRHVLLEGFQVECARQNLTEFGILFSDTTFSQHSLKRVSVLHARAGFGVLHGSGANGEFLFFENCIAGYVERFFVQDPQAGQAFEPMFVNCHANLIHDAPSAIFELGGPQGGFGLTVINQSCSFVGKSPEFARRQPSAYLKLAGTTDNITVIGGRAEGLSAMLVQTDAAFPSASITFQGVTMAGMSTCSARPIIDSWKSRSAAGITFTAEKCMFQLDIESGQGDFAISAGPEDGSSYLFDRCCFRMAGRFSFAGGSSRNSDVTFQRCVLDRVSARNSRAASVRFDKGISSEAKKRLAGLASGARSDAAYHDPLVGNLLSEPCFGASSGVDVSAPSPWVHHGKSRHFERLGPIGPAGDSSPRARIFRLGAGSGVSQVIDSARIAPGCALRYVGVFAIDGSGESQVAFTLADSATGAVCDERIVTALPVLPLYVSLLAVSDGAPVVLSIENRSGMSLTMSVLDQSLSPDIDGIIAASLSDRRGE
jgi:hypothetical protein